MTNVNKDKYDLLVSVINALYDENQEVKVETVNLDANKAKDYAWYNTDLNNPQIPTRQGSYKTGAYSPNRMHAQSIKIGKISMRRIPLAPTPTKDGKFLIDNGYKYIVRTPEGDEAEFSGRDQDFERIWEAALAKYDMPVVNGVKGHPGDMDYYVKSVLKKHLKNPKLKEVAGKDTVHKDKVSAFEKSRQQLKSLGVEVSEEESKRHLAMIKNKRLQKE